LAACSREDNDPSVARACEAPGLPPLDDHADIYAFSADGQTLLRSRPVALLLSDGSVFVGYSDVNGHIRIHRAPSGDLRLEDPGLIPLEPPLSRF
jgi:hypothetical protein